jgi:hypothetical protein
MRGPVGKDIDDRLLEAGRDIRALSARQVRTYSQHRLRDRGLQAGETQIAPWSPCHRPGKLIAGRIAFRGNLFQRWATRPIQPQQLCDFVERLTNCVVHGPTQPQMLPDAGHRDTLRMSAGKQKQQIRE